MIAPRLFFDAGSLTKPGSTLLLLLVMGLAGCAGSPVALSSLEDLEIGVSVPVTQALPAIPMGSTTFHATNPVIVNLAAGQVQFLEFFAYWCTVCKAMAPSVHGLENLYRDQVTFVYLDRDDPATEAFRSQLGYIYQPHFFLLDADGTVLGEWRGYVDVEILQQAIVEAVQ